MDINWATNLCNFADFEYDYTELTPYHHIENSFKNTELSDIESKNSCSSDNEISDISINQYHEIGEWIYKPLLQWNRNDVSEWIRSFAAEKRFDLSQFRVDNFNRITDGTCLYSMTLDMFLTCDPKYGKIIYDSIHNSNIFEILPRFEEIKTPISGSDIQRNDYLSDEYLLTELERPGTIEEFDFNPNLPAVLPSSSDEDDESMSGSETTASVKIVKRGRGRPRGKTNSIKKKVSAKTMGCLWEFVRNLLHDPNYCPTVIRWENYEEGLFRFVKPEIIANLWGSRKHNQSMDYAKFSRALRYYYKLDIFQSVGNRRLVYKFGPTAQGWQTNNPNFEKTK